MADDPNKSLLQTTGASAFIQIMGLLGTINPKYKELATRAANRDTPINLPDYQTIIEMFNRELIESSKMRDMMKSLGFDQETTSLLLYTSQAYLSSSEAITLYRRGHLTYEELKHKMALNKTDHLIDQYLQMTEYFPSPQDLITFAVREVYTPETVIKFGQLEDLPDKFLSEALKAGVTEEQAKNYWAAHWQLPSAQMGFEMFHRCIDEKIDDDADEITLPSGAKTYNVIGTKTLEMLLKALDIMPFWRDKITEISYNPLTRVDVRRMYGFGVLTIDDVYKSYRDQGYNDFNARKMTEFTVAYENNEFDGITRANIIKSFKDNLITKDEMIEMFQGLRFSDRAIEFWTENAEWEKTLADIQSYTDDLADAFQAGQMTESELKVELVQMDVPAEFAETIFERIIRKKARRTKTIPLTDLNRWLMLGVIDQDEYIRNMRLLGYKDDHIQRYLEEAIQNGAKGKRIYLRVSDYVSFYNSGLLTKEKFTQTLHEMGISEDDIAMYVAGKEVADADAEKSS